MQSVRCVSPLARDCRVVFTLLNCIFKKMVDETLHFLVISFFIYSAGAQWQDPWIVLPPQSSAAFGHVNVSATTLDAEENIDGSTTLAVLRFIKGPDATFDPVWNSGCRNFIRLGPSNNNGTMDIISIKLFDFESGDNNSDVCTFYIAKPQIAVKTLNFNIKDMNDNRPFFDKYPSGPLAFSENKLGSLYQFGATDGDQADVSSLIYSFITLGGDGSNFTMNRQTGEFSVTKMLDYEAGQFYLFNMIVTDRGGLTGSTQVTLNVIDEKDSAPVWKVEVPYKNIPEEKEVNWTVFSVLAQDGDVTVNDQMVYSLVDARGSFSIDPTSGQVRIAKRIDRDVDNFDSYFDLSITATCKNYPTFKSVTYSTVFIDDINDNLPTFDRSVYDFVNVDEDFVGRLTEMDILVSDPDLKDFGSYVMSIEGSPEIKSHLQLSPSTGRNNGIFSLRINSTGLLDYENNIKRNVTLTIVAKEISGNQSSSSVINLYSRDINDNSPNFIQTEFTATIVENVPIGSLVTTVKAIDADLSSDFGQPSIRYSIVENFDAARYFTINDTSGEIRTSIVIDRESSSSVFNYTVQAIDKNGNYDGQRDNASLVITIRDVNDDPPAFSPPSAVSFPMWENATSGTELTKVSASDKDDNPNLLFSINWDNCTFYKNRAVINNYDVEWKKSFVLKTVSRAWSKLFSRVIYSLTASVTVGDSSLPPGNCNECSNSPLDREKFDSVQLCLTVTDNNTIENRNKDEIYVMVDILDVNDNDPVFDVVDKEFTIVEGNATMVGTVFGSCQATDMDVNNTITYSISSCDNVAVDANNGQLSTTGLIDREQIDLIECVVKATDGGLPARSSKTTVRINVVDVNDNEPVLTVTPDQVPIYECSPKSQTKNGYNISKLTATDADIGAFGNVSFMLSQQNSEGVDEFAIDLYTGDMTVRDCKLIDFETKTSYSVVVEARDNYRQGITFGSLSAFQRINITLLDVNDNAPTLSSPVSPCHASPWESLERNDTVTLIQGSDKDSNGPNRWITFTLRGQTAGQLDKCQQLFRMETVDNSTGKVLVNVANMLDCTGSYDLIVQACDQGDGIEGVLCSVDTTYRICVLDVNNNYPQFVFPEMNNTVFEVPENSPIDFPLLYNGTNSELTFKATDSDQGANGQIVYTWSDDSVNDVFLLNKDSGVVTLKSKLNRTDQSYYNLVVVATDKGVPSTLSSQMNLRINVRLSNKQLPYFPSNTESLSFTENQMENLQFQNATDKDNINLYPGESRYDVCYFVVCGNSEYFEVPNKFANKLETKKTLDRENPPVIPYVVVYTSNDCNNKPTVGSCSDIDVTKGQYLNITIKILDVNDCDPEFSGSLSGGITQGDKKDTRVFPMDINDRDENDSVTCKIEDEFNVSSSSVGLANVKKPPFRIDPDQWIALLFDVQPDMKGFFTLNVTCEDKMKHSSWKSIKIYVVTQENKLDIVFDNKKEEIEAKRSEIETIFTTTMGYRCNVEKVVGYDAAAGNSSYNSALSHFIDETKEEAEPVSASVIIAKKSETSITNELISRCRDEGLNLISVGPLPTETNTSEAIFKILFIIVCVVVFLLIVIVAFLFFSNSELKRRLAAFVGRPSFSSDGSKIDRPAMVVPGSNKHALGTSNPLCSHSNHDSSFDNMSQSSGDSILIGVENNPEFNSKKSKTGRIEDDLVFTFENVSRRNPLVNDSPPEPAHPPPPPPPQRSVKRSAPPVPVDRYESDQSDDDYMTAV